MLNSFKISKHKKNLIIGIGNTLRADDGVGPYIIAQLSQSVNITKAERQLYFINAGTTPENFTDDIIRLKPETIIIIDAARMNKDPGEIVFFEGDKIPETSISTHNLSLQVISALWGHITNAQIRFIGIEPKSVNWQENCLSGVVKKNADKLIAYLHRCLTS